MYCSMVYSFPASLPAPPPPPQSKVCRHSSFNFLNGELLTFFSKVGNQNQNCCCSVDDRRTQKLMSLWLCAAWAPKSLCYFILPSLIVSYFGEVCFFCNYIPLYIVSATVKQLSSVSVLCLAQWDYGLFQALRIYCTTDDEWKQIMLVAWHRCNIKNNHGNDNSSFLRS